MQALKITSRDNGKKKSSGADDAESDDDSEDEDTGLPDADPSAATDTRDISLPGIEKPKTEIAGLASLRSLFEGTENDPPMPVDYLRGVNSKCACSKNSYNLFDMCQHQLLTHLQARIASSRFAFVFSCRWADIR